MTDAAVNPSAPPGNPSVAARTREPPEIWVAWVALAAGALALGRHLWQVWSEQPDFSHGFLVVPLAGWFAWEARGRFHAAPRKPIPWAVLMVPTAAVVFSGCWWLHLRLGPRPLLLYLMGVSLLWSAAGLLLMRHGWKRSRTFAYSFLLVMMALPFPDAIREPVRRGLKSLATVASAELMPVLGIPVEREPDSSILQLPGGNLGVEDACSGIRSLTAMTAFAVVVAGLRGFTIPMAVLLKGCAVLAAVAANLVRIVATGAIQEVFGREYTQDPPGDLWNAFWQSGQLPWHTLLGYMVFVVGVGLILAIERLFPEPRPDPPPASGPFPDDRRWLRLPVCAVVAGAALFCGWTRVGEAEPINAVGLEELPREIDGWVSEPAGDLPVPYNVQDMLAPDEIVHRVYRDGIGRSVELYVMFWATHRISGGPHDPDICLSHYGARDLTEGFDEIHPAGVADPLPVQVRTYCDRSGGRHVLLYWYQYGSKVDRRIGALQSDWNYLKEIRRFGSDEDDVKPYTTAQIFVWARSEAMLSGPEATQKRLGRFLSRMTEHLHRKCPWAVPTATGTTR
jgi:exosortase